MALIDFLKRNVVKDERFKELQRELQMRKIIEERGKSANERELERFLEEKRQEEIKKRLEEIRHEKGRSFIDSENSILQQPNIFKEDPKNNILKQKSIFSHKSNNLAGKGMFFN